MHNLTNTRTLRLKIFIFTVYHQIIAQEIRRTISSSCRHKAVLRRILSTEGFYCQGQIRIRNDSEMTYCNGRRLKQKHTK